MTGSGQREAAQLIRRWTRRFPDIEEEFLAATRRPASSVKEVEAEAPSTERLLSREDVLPPLFDYQADLVSQFAELVHGPASNNKGLLSLPTGAGKTRTAAAALVALLPQEGELRAYWLAPTKELLAQAFATLTWAWRNHGMAPNLRLVRADLVGDFPVRNGSTIFFATPQMVAARAKKGRAAPSAGIVVFDEAHQMGAPSFLGAVESLRQGHAAVIGLSATPGRTHEAETEALVEYFGGRLLTSSLLGDEPVKELRRRGVFSRVRFRSVPGTEGSQSKRTRFNLTAKLCASIAKKRRVLVFAPSVAQAHALAVLCRRMSASAGVVSGSTPDPERREILRLFECGDIRVLLNKSVLATGYDCPAVSDVVLGAPIRSPILFEQIVGRVTRGPAVGGSSNSNVWEFESHLALHDRPSSYHRFRDHDWS